MGVLKNISKKSWGSSLIAKLIEGYVRFVWLTSRWEEHNQEEAEKAWGRNVPFLGVFWHSRLLMTLKIWKGHKGQKAHVLISSHSDGAFIAKAAQAFGYEWLAGSTNRQGAKAVRNILDVLENGDSIAITPDGPRGPRYTAKENLITIARMAGVDIYPVAYSAKRGIFLRSWDRFFLPFPFNKGVFVYTAPVLVSQSQRSDDDLKQELVDKLNAVTREADELCGWADKNPGEVPAERQGNELVA